MCCFKPERGWEMEREKDRLRETQRKRVCPRPCPHLSSQGTLGPMILAWLLPIPLAWSWFPSLRGPNVGSPHRRGPGLICKTLWGSGSCPLSHPERGVPFLLKCGCLYHLGLTWRGGEAAFMMSLLCGTTSAVCQSSLTSPQVWVEGFYPTLQGREPRPRNGQELSRDLGLFTQKTGSEHWLYARPHAGVLGSLWWPELVGVLSSWDLQSHGSDRLKTRQLQLRVMRIMMGGGEVQAFCGCRQGTSPSLGVWEGFSEERNWT